MTRGFRGILLVAGMLAAGRRIGPCSGDWLDLRQSHRPVRRRAAGRDGHGDGSGAAAAAGRDHVGQRHLSVPQRADRHVHRDVRAGELQEGRSRRTSSSRPASTPQIDQKLEIGQMTEEVTVSAASPVVDTKKTTTGATFTDGHPREDPDGARPVADHQHDAGRAGRPQRRRLGLGPAGRPRVARHHRRTCSGTSKADRSPTCRRTPRRRTSTSTRSSRSR